MLAIALLFNEIMARILNILKGLILLGVGMAAFYFAAWGDYWLLMNPDFKWLTLIGAVLVAVFGPAVALDRSTISRYSAISIFIILFMVIFGGRPYSTAVNPIAKMINPFALSDTRNSTSGTTNIRLNEVFFSTQQEIETKYTNQIFTTIGQVKRLPELDKQGYFALMEYVMFCCAADALALGFLVPLDQAPAVKDWDWVEVTGKLNKTTAPLTVPLFRFGSAVFTKISENYIIKSEKVAKIEHPFQRPAKNITDILIDSPNNSIFCDALWMTGYMKKLDDGNNYTIFAVFDEIFTESPTLATLFGNKNDAQLKRFIGRHIVKGNLLKKDLYGLSSLTTVNNEEILIRVENGKITIGEASILFADRIAKNGVVHYIYPSIK